MSFNHLEFYSFQTEQNRKPFEPFNLELPQFPVGAIQKKNFLFFSKERLKKKNGNNDVKYKIYRIQSIRDFFSKGKKAGSLLPFFLVSKLTFQCLFPCRLSDIES